MSQEVLDLLLSGVKDQGQRKQITSAYYAFARGDPETFAVQFAVILKAFAASIKLLPIRIQKALATETDSIRKLVLSRQASPSQTGSDLSPRLANDRVGEVLGATEKRIEELLAAHSEALRAERENIVTAMAASDRISKQLAAHRIVFGLILSYTAGALSVLAVQHLLPFLL